MGFVSLPASVSQLLHVRAAQGRGAVPHGDEEVTALGQWLFERASRAAQSRVNACACRFILLASPRVVREVGARDDLSASHREK
jgi:hypothetical protein